ILVTNIGGNSGIVSVLLNMTPTGSFGAFFTAQQTFATGTGPQDATLADINGDGKLDIIAANTGASTVSVLLNTTTPGSPTAFFADQQTFLVGAGPIFVVVGDVNADGKPDLVVANATSDTVSVLLNTTTGSPPMLSFADQQIIATGADPVSVVLGTSTATASSTS